MTCAALLLGDADCVFQDANAAMDMFDFDIIAAVNNIGLDWKGHVHHWFTLHPNKCVDWVGMEEAVRRRTVIHKRNRPVTWAHKHWRGIDRVTSDWSGGSGLFAIKGLLEIGCDAIVLAGIPMTSEGKHYYSTASWVQGPKYHRAWLKRQADIAPYVRSMSGWTKGLLGAP
jgi:hypothetical protein